MVEGQEETASRRWIGTVRRINFLEVVIVIVSFLFLYLYILSYGLTLDTDEISHIYFIQQLAEKGVLTKSFIKPFTLLLAVPAYYTSLYLLELMTALFASLLILFTYKLCTAFFNKRVGILTSALVLLNPMTLSLTLGGNSIIVQAAMLFISFYLLVSSSADDGWKTSLSFLFLFLACLTRPEPWIFIPLIIYHIIFVKQLRSLKAIGWPLLLLIVVPIIWILKDYAITGDPLWTVTSVKNYAETALLQQPTTFSRFPERFIQLMDRLFISTPFILLALIGFLLNIKNAKRTYILWSSFLLLFLLYWVFVGKGMLLFPRFLYIPYLVIVIYSAVGIDLLLERTPLKTARAKTLAVFLSALILISLFEAPKIRDARGLMRQTSAINRDVILASNVLKVELGVDESSSVLLSSRRIPLMRLQMRGYEGLNFVSYRQFYKQAKPPGWEGIDWVVFDLKDMYPRSAVYQYFTGILISEERLIEEGIKLNRAYRTSDKAVLLKLNPHKLR
jgi:hypothetical protein